LALFFSSGGGRLGNQILNLIHLIAISLEYDIDVIKINDPYLIANDGSLMFKINENKSTWSLDNRPSNKKIFSKLFLKFFIRLIHIFFYLTPKFRSYKIGSKNNYPKLILAKNLGENFSLTKLKKESKKYNVVLSGWGLRDWDMVLKHKATINKKLIFGFKEFIYDDNFKLNDYLFVHIRRGDFLEDPYFKDLNYEDEVWIKSIKKLCNKKKISKVVIFSDFNINKFFLSSLESASLKVFLPEIYFGNANFLKLFFSYLHRGSFVLCNSSSLVLSIAFLNHDKIYLPSKEKDYDQILLDDAHNTFPTALNWN
tara:strand:- start:587 stop:1522 length:936 start_codon:yes stop_codon:yes gene_type:complete